MHWEVINNDRSSLQEYRLIDNNDSKVVIKYNPLHHSARITSGNHHRLFFFESAGSLSGKTIFKNEYGMEVGSLVHDKYHPQEGALIINAKKYQYDLQVSATTRLVIYENASHQPIATCDIQIGQHNFQQLPHSQAIDNNCCLLGLCWYLSLGVKDMEPEYSSAGL